MQKVKRFCDKIFTDRKIRFLFVGVLNTAVGYGAYALFIFLGMHYAIAQFASTVIAVAHSYLWNKHFTFKSKGKSAAEAARFAGVYGVSYLFNLLLLYVFIDLFGINHYLAGLITLFATTVISYVGHKTISFKNITGEESNNNAD